MTPREANAECPSRAAVTLSEEDCGMNSAEIRATILGILGDILPDDDLSGLKDDVPLREQIELDSMDFLDIVMELRKRYRIQIPEDDYIHLATLASTVKYLEPLMKDVAKR
jgi:acyl carrier protein